MPLLHALWGERLPRLPIYSLRIDTEKASVTGHAIATYLFNNIFGINEKYINKHHHENTTYCVCVTKQPQYIAPINPKGVITMRCPHCNSSETKVVDKRDATEQSSTRRRRECLACNKRFTTYEKIEARSLRCSRKTAAGSFLTLKRYALA